MKLKAIFLLAILCNLGGFTKSQSQNSGGETLASSSIIGRLTTMLNTKGWGKVVNNEDAVYLPQLYNSWFRTHLFDKVVQAEAINFHFTHGRCPVSAEWLAFSTFEDAAAAAGAMELIALKRIPYKPPLHWHWIQFREGVLMLKSKCYPVSSLEFAGVLHVAAQVVFEMRWEGKP